MMNSFSLFRLISISSILVHLISLSGTIDALALISPPTPISSTLSSKQNLSKTKIPFVVQQLKGQPLKDDADQISSIVISVFFQEEAERLPENRSMGSITKPLILAYLKNLQFGDVRGKKYMLGNGINNSMFVARRVVPVGEGVVGLEDSLTLSELAEQSSVGATKGKIYNKDQLSDSKFGYATGDILGFVDVTEKNFGLPGDNKKSEDESKDNNSSNDDEGGTIISSGESMLVTSNKGRKSLRPVLTNLSVKQEARCSGVGSALVDSCESVVMERSEWSRDYFEMVLEVEEENEAAQRFYEKRSYVAMYSDPSSRRYDTSGLLLNNVRTTKICYRKDLTQKGAQRGMRSGSNDDGPGMFFAKIRQFMGL